MHSLQNQTLARFLAAPGRFALFGSSKTGEGVFHALAQCGLKPTYFLDSHRTGDCLGLEIRPPEEALAVETVVIAGSRARDMTVQLRADGFEGAVLDLSEAQLGARATQHDETLLDGAADSLDFARSLLEDDGSREVFDGVLDYRRELDPGSLPPEAPTLGHPALPVQEAERVIDIGSEADALLDLATEVGPMGAILGIEADPRRREILEDLAANHEAGARVRIHAVGFDRRRTPHTIDGTEAPTALSLDDFVWEQASRVDRVQILSDGARITLAGASGTLAEHRPRLVIDLARAPLDLWEIPILLKEHCPGYRLHLAHHSPNGNGTRLYAKPPETG